MDNLNIFLLEILGLLCFQNLSLLGGCCILIKKILSF